MKDTEFEQKTREADDWSIPKQAYADLVTTSSSTLLTSSFPKAVGYYQIGGSLHVYLTRKPNKVHRYFTKLLLGWEWKDSV